MSELHPSLAVRTRIRYFGSAVAWRLPLVVALVTLWYLFEGWEGRPGSRSPAIGGVVEAAYRLVVDGTLVAAAQGSWDTVIRGFVIAAALGIPIGLLMGSARVARNWLEPLVDFLRPIAPFAWIPMAILWFGGSQWASVSITAYAAFFPIVTNTFSGVMRIEKSMLLAARTLGAGRVATFFQIVLPGALPFTIVGLRLGIGMSWAAVVAAEIATGASATGTGGLGFLLYTSLAVTFDMNVIVVAMIAIGISAYAVDLVLGFLDRKLISWPAR